MILYGYVPNSKWGCMYDNKVVSQASRIISGTGHVVSCPARMHLPARNSLVNEVEFLGLNVVMTNEIVRLVIIM